MLSIETSSSFRQQARCMLPLHGGGMHAPRLAEGRKRGDEALASCLGVVVRIIVRRLGTVFVG